MKRRTERRAIAAGLVALALATVPAVAGDWPTFRGDPGLTGVGDEELPADLQPIWVFETEEEGFESTATVQGGAVYAGSLDGHVYALDLDTGRELWRFAAGAPVKSSPSVREGTVFFGDEDGVFHAVDAKTGEGRWRFEAGAEIVSSANFAAGCVVFGSHDESLYCLEPADGKLRWKVETEGYVFGTPAVAEGLVYSAGCDGVLRTVRAADGVQLREAEVGGYVGASPALTGGRAYFGTFDNRVLEARDIANLCGNGLSGGFLQSPEALASEVAIGRALVRVL